MASHCAESTAKPRNDPVHPPFSLSCADGWPVKADVMKQPLRKHVRPHGLVATALVFTSPRCRRATSSRRRRATSNASYSAT